MQNTTNYDTIIENIYKEWSEFIMDTPTLFKNKWETPQYSTSQVEKAGKFIANTENFFQNKMYMDILNNWRSAHAYPLHIIASNLRRKNKNVIVVQRLKRLDSIVNKLQRNPTMNLAKMQDLGGCRVIVDSINEVYFIIEKYKSSKIRHI